MAAEREERPEEGPESSSDAPGSAGGPQRRGLGRGLGAILPARAAVPLELVGLGERSATSSHEDDDVVGRAEGGTEDQKRLGPNTIELRPSSRLCTHTELVMELDRTLALADATRAPGLVAVVVLGIDGFRHVNAAFGRDAGDALLQALGERLVRARRRDDLVGRLQGDEHVVVCCQVESPLGARHAVERLISDFDAPVAAGGAEHRLRATFGLALHVPGEEALSAPSMISRAQLAKRRAKEAGLRWAVFAPERDGYQRPRWNTSFGSRRGLEADEDGRSSPLGWPTRTAPT